MYCEKCGKELRENEVCDCMKSQTESKKKGVNKGGMFGAVAVVIAIFAIIFATTRPEKIELADYLVVEPEYMGFNGHAELSLEQVFDERALSSLLYSYVEGKSSVKGAENMSEEEFMNALEDGAGRLNAAEQILSDIQIKYYKNGETVEECKDLSNGDKIKIAVSTQNPVNKELNVKLIGAEKEFTVDGLIDGTPVSVFGDDVLSVSFTGMNGEGTVQINTLVESIDGFKFDYYVEDNFYNFSNGDVAVVRADYDKELLESNGYYVEEESREYVVSGLAEHVASVDVIPDIFVDELKVKFNDEWNDKWNRVFIGAGDNEVSYEKMYFGLAKSGTVEFENCILVTGKYMDIDSGETVYCYSVLYNLTVSEEGTLTFRGRELSECDMDTTNWGLDFSELDELISNDESYEFTEIYQIEQ